MVIDEILNGQHDGKRGRTKRAIRLPCNYVINAVVITSLMLLLTACKEKADNPVDQHAYMTQCIHDVSNGATKKFETLFHGQKRICNALLWRIPKKYVPNVGLLSNHNDAISTIINIDNPPESVLPLWHAREQQKTELEIQPYWENPGESLMVSFRNNAIGIFNLNEALKKNNGWHVYDCVYKEECDVRRVVFYKAQPIETLVECGPPRDALDKKQLPAKAVCRIQTNIDNRVYVEYTVLYESFDQWDNINQSVISFAKSLMLN